MAQGPHDGVQVFVDETGSRRRIVRRLGKVTGAACCAYALVLAVNLTSQQVPPPDDWEGPDFPGGIAQEPRADVTGPLPVVPAPDPPLAAVAAPAPKSPVARPASHRVLPAPHVSRPKPVAVARHREHDEDRESDS